MKNNRQHHKSPWRNSDGTLKSDHQISLLGQHWDLKTWDDYLRDTVDVSLKEMYMGRHWHIDLVAAEEARSVFADIPTSQKIRYLSESLDELTPPQKEILQLLFGSDDVKLPMAARVLRISRQAVIKRRNKALANLKSILCCKIVDLNITKFIKRYAA